MDVLMIVSHKMSEEETKRVGNLFPNIVILSEPHFPAVEKRLRHKKYKLVVILSLSESLPPSWNIERLSALNPIMILLKVNMLDLFVFYTFLDAVGLLADTAPTVKDDALPLMYKSIEYIEENLCENDLSLERVAASIYVSRCHYSRMFKEYFGIGFKEYIMNKRIQKAKVMLQEGNPVTEVCYAVGYGDLTHFGRIFKKLVGVNPSDYRRQKYGLKRCV